MRLPLLVFLVISFTATPLFSQVNEFGLSPVNLHTYPCTDTGTVVVDVNVKIVNTITAVQLPLWVTGTSNPVLDTVLTGGLTDSLPPAFNPPSLFSAFCIKIINPYPTAPGDPILFVVLNVGSVACSWWLHPPDSGLYCRTYWKVTSPGTMIWRAGFHSRAGGPIMTDSTTYEVPVNWHAGDTVGVFDIVGGIEQPPVVNCPDSLNALVGEIIPVNVTAIDTGGSPLQGIFLKNAPCGNGIFSGPVGNWTYTWNTQGCSEGDHELVFGVYDQCETTYCTTHVRLTAAAGFVKIGCVTGDPCELVNLPVLLKANVPFGGFDLYLEFDPTLLYFKGVEWNLPAGFEYKTYRQLPCPMCGCCKYKLELLGLYDIKNLVQGVPIQPSDTFITIAYLDFQIACDQNLRGYDLNVCFEFDEGNCTQNSFSDVSGNVLYVSDNPAFFSYAACDTQNDNNQNLVLNLVHFDLFAPPCTINPAGRPCGGVSVNTIGGKQRGDINLNQIAYEVADAVLLSSYFIYGTSLFTIDPSVQIANTDINADGYPLSLSDFVLMLRIMTHDATSIPMPIPGSDLATIYAVTKGNETRISTNANLGAILFIFDGAVKVSTDLKNVQGVVNNQTRVLVYMNSNTGITGQLLTAEGKLVSVEAVDNFGKEMKITVVNRSSHVTFDLYPNYPNPFNPTTNISFALPIDSKVSLKIYNVAGQLVRTLVNETMVAGTHTVTWDGINSNGEKVASGIYFYKLNAGDYSKTMKMVMTQ